MSYYKFRALPRLMAGVLGLAGVLSLSVGCGDDPGDGIDTGPELVGAGDRNLTEFWPAIAIPLSDNAKLLTFSMMKNEVMRATGLSWVEGGQDLWDANRTVLGGADYAETFSNDRTPSQQKLVTVRKMAFSVCGALVAQESGQAERTVFTVVDPSATIDPAGSDASSQVTELFTRFFLTEPLQIEVTEALTLLGTLQDQADAGEAWRGLCTAYLSSMRFLTY